MGAKDFLNSLLLKELFKGMSVTGRYMIAPKITIQYPEETTPQSNRFRGLASIAGRESIHTRLRSMGYRTNRFRRR